jgi:hypothetical protein
MAAATLSDQNTLSKDPSFVGRVQSALVTAALAVIAEAETTADHAARASYARAVLSSPASYAALMAIGVATNAQVTADAGSPASQANVTDADIVGAIVSLWNPYAVGG